MEHQLDQKQDKIGGLINTQNSMGENLIEKSAEFRCEQTETGK